MCPSAGGLTNSQADAAIMRRESGNPSRLRAMVRDAFSNRIVGWKTNHRCDTDLVLGALEYATWSRDIGAGELIHHSDSEYGVCRMFLGS